MLSDKVFAENMAILCELYERELTDMLLKAYYSILSGLTDEQFNAAVQNILRTRKYTKLPMPAEFLELINQGAEIKAQIALDELERVIDTTGPNYSVSFGDRIIHAVVMRLGGWEWINTQKLDEWKWIRKDFIRLYCIYASKPKDLDIPERLEGRCEHNCQINGFDFNRDFRHMLIEAGDISTDKALPAPDKIKELTRQITDKIDKTKAAI